MSAVTRFLAAAAACILVAASAHAADTLAAAYGADWKQLPDWRGVWFLEEPLVFPGPGHAVIAKAAASKNDFEHGVTPGSYFTGAPYKPQYQKIYDERVAKARDQGVVADPIENCYTPHGMPRLMGATPGAAEFFVTPKQTWIVWDYMNQTRRIYTDGRRTPSEDMKWPRTMGYSTGHWEGQTLVADTVWTKDGIYDRTGAPHSDQLHIVERITRTDADTITVEAAIEDPVMFTQPWKVTRHFKKSAKKWENVPGSYCAYQAEEPK
jgi:hypothetical protein